MPDIEASKVKTSTGSKWQGGGYSSNRKKKKFSGGGFAGTKRRRFNYFKKNPEAEIHFNRLDVLVNFVNNKGKILPRRLSGLTPLQQRHVAKAIKRARHAGLLPYSYK